MSPISTSSESTPPQAGWAGVPRRCPLLTRTDAPGAEARRLQVTLLGSEVTCEPGGCSAGGYVKQVCVDVEVPSFEH